MTKNKFNTPILFLIFNRQKETFLVFNQIRKIKPTKLYIASDGARRNIKTENNTVNEIRTKLLKNINWDCDVKTLFRDKNLGCKYAVSGAINWSFIKEKESTVLLYVNLFYQTKITKRNTRKATSIY